MADIDKVYYDTATATDAYLVANCALLLEEVLAIKLDASVRNAIASSAGWVHTTFAQTACGQASSGGSSLPQGDDEENGGDKPQFAALAKNVADLSSEVANLSSDISFIKRALVTKGRQRNSKPQDSDDALINVDDGKETVKNSCYKYTGLQVIGSGVVSRLSIFKAAAAAGFSSLAGSFSAAGSLTVVTNYNFRFMLAPANLTEGPSWDASKEKWIIPWKDENDRDKESVEPLVNRLCNPPKCANDVVTGTAVALFDVVAAFYVSGSAGANHLTSSAEIRAAVAGLTRTALVAPVTFTHSSGSAAHQPLVKAVPPPT
jgi:hypothetical protein